MHVAGTRVGFNGWGVEKIGVELPAKNTIASCSQTVSPVLPLPLGGLATAIPPFTKLLWSVLSYRLMCDYLH